MCTNKSVTVFEGKPICKTCREMVRRRVARGVAHDKLLLASKRKGKRWAMNKG